MIYTRDGDQVEKLARSDWCGRAAPYGFYWLGTLLFSESPHGAEYLGIVGIINCYYDGPYNTLLYRCLLCGSWTTSRTDFSGA